MHLFFFFFFLLLFYRYHYSPILVAFAERIFSGETHYFAQNLLALHKCSTSTLGDV